MSDLTHFNNQGDAHMVDVGDKNQTARTAVCEGRIYMEQQTLEKIIEGSHKKGDVLGIARIAGIMGAKKTSELVPLCHPLMLTHVEIELEPESNSDAGEYSVYCQATVETRGQTGVEMEALTAVQVSLLTIYDMCKAIDRGMTMSGIRLTEKKGGKSGHWKRD